MSLRTSDICDSVPPKGDREMGDYNPRLQRAYLDIVENQIKANDPPQTRETLDRLMAEGISESDAKLHIAGAMCYETWDIMKNKSTFNQQRYLRNLKNLPREPEI